MTQSDFQFPGNFFVTGTDTGIGKTVVSAILTAGLEGVYWKPIQSGLEEQTDTEFVKEKTGLPQQHFIPERYRLQTPMSPHASAAIDGVSIELEDFELPEKHSSSHLIIEGAGGLMVPINDEALIIDLIKQFEIPVLLVARSGLGTLNHTLLSIDQLRRYEIPCLGVVMNGERHKSNRKAIEHYGQTNVLAELEPIDQLNPRQLKIIYDRLFDSQE